MPNQIDRRVVQMQFDNQQFEANAKQTIGTLDSLKGALNLEGAAKGFDGIANAAKNISFGTLVSDTETVQMKISAMAVASIAAINNLANSVVNAGKRMVNALTIAPISQGFEEYELKMGSVQTIMASTGASLAEVNGYLEELNTYADRTIYSFSDMTNSIGKFTNSGVALEDAVRAIQGISNEAALSGANAQQASHAMYNFAQALSSGAVKLIDWKSIENANMATVEFKQELIDTAEQLGTLVKEGDRWKSTTTDLQGKVSDAFNATSMFNDSLSAQWMTTDVLVKTLNKYADETTDLGKRAFAAAQDVKTFSQLMDTLKEAVGSGWAQTWELVFGDFNEAKELWTDVNNVVSGFIDNVSSSRNELLRGGLSSGWKNLCNEGIRDATLFQDAIMEVGYAVNGQKGMGRILQRSDGDFLTSLQSGWVSADILQKAIDKTKKDLGDLSDEELKNAHYTKENAEAFLDFAAKVDDGTISLDYFADVLSRPSGRENIIAALGNVFEALLMPIKAVTTALREIFPPLTADRLYQLTSDIRQFTSHLILSDEAAYTLKVALKVLLLPIKAVAAAVEVAITVLALLAMRAWELIDALLAIPAKVKPVKFSLKEAFGDERWARITEALATIVQKLGDMCVKAAEKVRDFIESLELSERVADAFERLKQVLGPIAEWAMDGVVLALESVASLDFEAVPDMLEQGFLALGNAADFLADKIGKLFKALSQESMPDGLKFVEASVKDFRSTVDEIAPTSENLTTAFGNVFDVFSKIGESIGGVGDKFGELLGGLTAGKILVLAFGTALTGFTFKAMDAIESIGGLAGSIGESLEGLSSSASGLMDTLSERFKQSKTDKFTQIVFTIAGGIAVLVAALAVLGSIPRESLVQGGIALGAIAAGIVVFTGALAAIAVVLSKIEGIVPIMKSLSIMIGVFSASVLVLSLAIVQMSNMNTEKIGVKLAVFSVVLIEFVGAILVLSALAPKLSSGALLIIAFALGLKKLIEALQLLVSMDLTGLKDKVGVLAILIAALVALAVGAGHASFGSALALTIFVLDLVLLLKVAQKFQQYDMKDILAGVIAMSPIIAAMAAILLATNLAGPMAIKAAIAMVPIALALNLMTGVVKALGTLDPSTLVKGTMVVAVLEALFAGLIAVTKFAGPNALKAGAAIGVMALAMLGLQLVVKYLGGLDIGTLTKGVAALSVMMIVFGLVIMMSKEASASKGTIIALGAVIGVLSVSLMMLTLLPGDELLVSAIALSSVILALGVAMKNLEAMEIKQAVANAAVLVIFVGSITAALILLARMEIGNVLFAALSLSAVMLAFAAMTKVMETIPWKDALVQAGLAAVFITTISVALWALNDLDPANMLTTALSLSAVLLALGASSLLMAKGGMTFETAIASAISMGAMLGAIILSLTVLKDWDPTDLSSKIASISKALIAVAAVTAIMGVIGKYTKGWAAVGGLAAAGVMLELTALIEAFGAMTKINGFTEFLDRGAEIFAKIGDAIGGFVGGILGGIAGGVIKGIGKSLVSLSTDLAAFSVGIMPFIATSSKITEESVAGVKSLADMILTLTKADLLQGISKIFGGGEGGTLSKFAAELAAFAPDFVKFSQTISQGDINPDVVNAAAEMGHTLAELQSSLPRTGGVLQEWFGQKDLSTFGNGLEQFANGIVAYSQAISAGGAIDWSYLEQSAQAGQMLSDLASSLPSSGGVLQEWFGEKDLGKFGLQISAFGLAIVGYSNAIKQGSIDAELIESSVNAAEMLTGLANSLPTTGGVIREWFTGGKMDLATFGTNLQEFAKGFKGYCTELTGVTINTGVVESSVNAAKAIAELAASLPETGGAKGLLFGNKDLAGFGAALKEFGSSLAAFYKEVAGIDTSSGNPVEKLRGLGADLVTAVKSGIEQEKGALLLAGKQLKDEFIKTFDGADKQLNTTGNNMGKALVSGATSALGMASSQSPSSVFRNIGTYAIQGLINGVQSKTAQAQAAIRALSNSSIAAAKQALDVHSPSGVFKEIGSFLVQGLTMGIRQNEGEASNAAVKMGKNLLEAVQKFFGIHSPSVVMKDEVGHYLIKGIAEGITEDMSAEEAAEKKAQNIVSAFSKALSNVDLKKNRADLQYQLWENLFDADAFSEEQVNELTNKKQNEKLEAQLKAQAERVRLAEAEYKATMEKFPQDSDRILEANNKWLQEQVTMSELSKQLADLNKEYNAAIDKKNAEQAQMAAAWPDILASRQELLDELVAGGNTRENVIKMWQDEIGYDPNYQSKFKYDESLSNAQGVYDRYMQDYEVDVEFAVEQATKKAVSSGTTKGATSSKATTAAKKAGETTAKNVAKGTTSSSSQKTVQKAVSKSTSSATKKATSDKSTQNKYKDSAAGIVDGLVDGVSGKIDSLKQSAKDAAKKWLGGFDDTTKTHSPSLEMIERGQYLVDGLAIGIESEAKTSLVGAARVLNGEIQNAIFPGERFSESFTSEFRMAGGEATSVVDSMISQIYESEPVFYSAGEALGNAFVTAFSSAMTTSEQNVNNLAAAAMTGALNVLGSAPNYTGSLSANTSKMLSSNYTSRLANANVLIDAGTSRYLASGIALRQARTVDRQNGTTSTTSSTEINFTQNNYSPKSLSAVDIYRQTKNGLSQFKGV